MIITAGKFKGRKIETPDEKITRPTLSKVRMGVFNILQTMIDFEGCSFLDMFAGSGIMGLEALSRGFKRVVAIEKNPKSAKILKENYNNIAGKKVRRLEGKPDKEDRNARGIDVWQFNNKNVDVIQQEQQDDNSLTSCLPYFKSFDNSHTSTYQDLYTSVLMGDCLKILSKTNEKFDVIYIDPPYFSKIYEKSLDAVKNSANNIIILEHVTNVDFKDFAMIKQKKYGDKFITFLAKL